MKEYGDFIELERFKEGKSTKIKLKCKICGKTQIVNIDLLYHSRSRDKYIYHDNICIPKPLQEIEDMIILEKFKNENNQIRVRAKCKICGKEHVIAYSNLFDTRICKNYIIHENICIDKTPKEYGDFILLKKYVNEKGLDRVDLKCKICGRTCTLPYSNICGYTKDNYIKHENACIKIEKHEIFGDFELLYRFKDDRGIRRAQLKCKICGLEKSVVYTHLYNKKGNATSHEKCCERQRKREKMAAMNDFGDYELIETMENPNLNNDHKLGRFRCKICGREKVTTISSMKNSKTKSHKFCILQVNPDKHFRGIFASMKTRCNNPNVEKYKNYGGRGIKCDYEYLIDFYDDFYEEYLEHVAKHGISNTTVERKDVNKGYTKDNITFATLQEQARNKTNLTPVMVTNNETGEKLYFSCAPEAAERLGVSSSLVYHRIYSEDTQNQNPYNGYVFERMDEFKLIKPIIHEDRELIKPFYFEEY